MRTGLYTTRRSPALLLIIALSVLALVLAACGTDPDDEEAAPDPAEDPAEDDADEPAEDPDDDVAEEDDEDEADVEDAAEFYRNNNVTLAVGSSPGGGYDAYMRMLAPYLEEELGTTVVVDNETGGGGLLMVNNAVIDSEQDGTKLMIINGVGVAGSALSEAEGVAFDLAGLSYVGMVSAEAPVLSVRADSEYETLDDLAAAEGFLFGATGVASAANMNASALIAALGLDASVATAFEGSSELDLALLAGDLDGFTGSFDSRIPSIEAGETRALLIVDETSEPPLEDVPNVTDLGPYYAEGGEAIMDAHLAMTQFHRPLATHPDIPEDRLEYLREVFARVMQNPDLIAESEEQDRPLAYMPGEEVAELAQRLVDAPEAYLEVVRGAQD